MNIQKQNADALNALLTIELTKDDFQPKVDKALKDVAKNVSIKGFRPGHAPVGMIKRMYGKQVLVDELNKLVGETLTNYIRDNKIEILGEPLPSEDQEVLDLDKEVEKATFKFDLGLAPELDVNVDNSLKINRLKIEVSDEDIDKSIKNIAGRFGKQEPVETSSTESLIKGAVSIDGQVRNEYAIVSVSVIKDAEQQNLFVGKKAGDVVGFDLRKAFPEDSEVSYLLGIGQEEAKAVTDTKAEIKITEITDYKEAEVNEDLFSKAFPGKEIKDEVAFREQVKENIIIGNSYGEEWQLHRDVQKALEEKVGKFELPEAFLKRWLTVVNKDNEKATPEVIDSEFPAFLDNLRWRVIKNKVATKNEIKIEQADIVDNAKRAIQAQFLQYGVGNIPDENLTQYALNQLKNAEERERYIESALENKVIDLVVSKAEVSEKNISRSDFDKYMSEKEA